MIAGRTTECQCAVCVLCRQESAQELRIRTGMMAFGAILGLLAALWFPPF